MCVMCVMQGCSRMKMPKTTSRASGTKLRRGDDMNQKRTRLNRKKSEKEKASMLQLCQWKWPGGSIWQGGASTFCILHLTASSNCALASRTAVRYTVQYHGSSNMKKTQPVLEKGTMEYGIWS